MFKLDREIELFSNKSGIPADDIRKNIAGLGFSDEEVHRFLCFEEDADLNPFFILATEYYHDIYYLRENTEKFSDFRLKDELLNLYYGFVNLSENVDLDVNAHVVLSNLDQNINDAIKYNNDDLEKIRGAMTDILKYNGYIVFGDKGIEGRISGLANMELILRIIKATQHEKNALALYEIREFFPGSTPETYDYYYLESLQYYQTHIIDSIVDLIFDGYDDNAHAINELIEPLYLMSEDDMDFNDYAKIEKNIKENIFGQEKQVEQFIKRLKVLEFGRIKEKGAKAVFLLAGPTGVGKTELAKQLSAEVNLPMFRMDMSEYKESHQISKIIGSPPGYVGSDEKGTTVFDLIAENGKTIILVDEIEKAHPSILNIFLHIFDEGKAKNNKQKEIDFSECVFILTTNIGAEEASKNPLGFKQEKDTRASYKGAIERKLKPEFINRIDEIIYFNRLNEKNIKDIIDLTLSKMKGRLKEKGYEYSFDVKEAAYDYLLSRIEYKKYGAREVFRVISDVVIPDLIEISHENKDGVIDINFDEEIIISRKNSRSRKKK